jgi:DNA-binding XRE family transcriptional regulator
MRKVILSNKIKDFRKRKQITQRELGEMLEVSSQAVSKWEREDCYPDISLLPVIADTIGCKVDDFFE